MFLPKLSEKRFELNTLKKVFVQKYDVQGQVISRCTFHLDFEFKTFSSFDLSITQTLNALSFDRATFD